MIKSELGMLLDEWLTSHEARQCLYESSMTMRDRMEIAFLSGAEAQREVDKKLAAKMLPWMDIAS